MDLPLPQISVPFTLPIEIPLLAHPPLVHFAIVLPLIVLVLEIINSFTKKKTLSVINMSMLFMIMVIMIGAFFTGKTDGTEAFEVLSKAGKEALGEHKLIGAYLLYFSIALFVIKMISASIKKAWLRILYMLILAGFVASTFYQGKEGGELVFKHGSNIEALVTAEEKIFDLKDEMEDLEEELKEYTEEEAEEAETPTAEVTEEKTEVTETPTAEVTEKKTEVTETPTEEVAEEKTEVTETPTAEKTEEKTEVTETPTAEVTEEKTEVTETPTAEVTEEKTEEAETPTVEVTEEKTEEAETPTVEVTEEKTEEAETPTAEESHSDSNQSD